MLNAHSFKALRELHGLSFRKMGSRIGVSRTMIYLIELGQRPITANVESKLLAYFKINDQQKLDTYLELHKLVKQVRAGEKRGL